MGSGSSFNCHPRKVEALEVHIVDDQCVVFDAKADCVHYLNLSAALVLEFCDGTRTAEDIAALVKEAYGLPESPVDEVNNCLHDLQRMTIVR